MYNQLLMDHSRTSYQIQKQQEQDAMIMNRDSQQPRYIGNTLIV